VTVTEKSSETDTRAEIPRIISVDDHLVEPPHLWQKWLPARWRDRGPRVERRRLGDLVWVGGAKMYDYQLEQKSARIIFRGSAAAVDEYLSEQINNG